MILEIIAFALHDRQFCVETAPIRDIRGWASVTLRPRAPIDAMGAMNLHGTVILVVDLAARLGSLKVGAAKRNAIVVTNVNGRVIALMVDRFSDILSVSRRELQ